MELILRRRVSKFDTVKGIAGLLQRGFIQAVEGEDALLLTTTVGMERRAKVYKYAAYAGLALGVILLVRAVIVTGSYFTVGSIQSSRAALTVPVAKAQQERIEFALESYKLLRGRYPQGLDALVQEGLLHRGDLVYPHGLPYRYTPPSNGGPYRLESP